MEYGVPVQVGGLTVEPGDIVMGDQHGVLTIPQEIAADIPQAVADVETDERVIIDYCNSPDFTPRRAEEAAGGAVLEAARNPSFP